MSTDRQPKPPTMPEPQAPDPTRTRHLDLSISQVLAGALAAMTAAALGSRLGVAGTVIGAAVASIVAAVASAVYTTSLTRTHAKVRTVFTGRVSGSGDAGGTLPTSTETSSLRDEVSVGWPSTQPTRTRRRLSWTSILVGALAAFALAAAVLTGLELVSGHALSGGDGTSITQVGSGDNRPAPAESTSTPSQTPTASATSTPEPSQEATHSPVPTPAPSGTGPSSTGPSTAGPTTPPNPGPTASVQPSTSASAAPEPSTGGSSDQGLASPGGGANTGGTGG